MIYQDTIIRLILFSCQQWWLNWNFSYTFFLIENPKYSNLIFIKCQNFNFQNNIIMKKIRKYLLLIIILILIISCFFVFVSFQLRIENSISKYENKEMDIIDQNYCEWIEITEDGNFIFNCEIFHDSISYNIDGVINWNEKISLSIYIINIYI